MSAEEKTYAEALGAGDPSGSSGESERISTTGDQSGRSSERLEAPSVAGPRSSGDQQDGSGSLDLMRPRAAAAASYLQGDQFGHSPDDEDVYSADGSFAGNNGSVPTEAQALELKRRVEDAAFIRSGRGQFGGGGASSSFSLETTMGQGTGRPGASTYISPPAIGEIDDTLASILSGADQEIYQGECFALSVAPGVVGVPKGAPLPGTQLLSAQFYTTKNFYGTAATSAHHVPLTAPLAESLPARQAGITVLLGRRVDDGIDQVPASALEREVIEVANLGGPKDEAAMFGFLSKVGDGLEDAVDTLRALSELIDEIGRGKSSDPCEDPASRADTVAKIIAVYFARAHRRDLVTKLVSVIRHAVAAEKPGITEALIKFIAVGPLHGDTVGKALTDLVDLHVQLSQMDGGGDAATFYHSQKTRFEASQVDPDSREHTEANGNIVCSLRGLALHLPSTTAKEDTTFARLTKFGASGPTELAKVTEDCFWQVDDSDQVTAGSMANVSGGTKRAGATQVDGAAEVLSRITIVVGEHDHEVSTSDEIKLETIIDKITARADDVCNGTDSGKLRDKLAHQFHCAGLADAETSDMFVQVYSYILAGNPTAVAFSDNKIEFKKIANSHRVRNSTTVSTQSLVRNRIGSSVRENKISKTSSVGIRLSAVEPGDASVARTAGGPGPLAQTDAATDPQAAVINELEAGFAISTAILQNAADAEGEVVMDRGHGRLTSEMRAASEGFIKVIRSIYASIHDGSDATMVREYKNSTVVQNGRSKEILDVVDAYIKALEKHEDLDLSELGELPGIIASRDDDGKELNPALQLYPSLSSAFTTICDPNVVMTVKSEPLALAPFQIFNFLKSSYALPPGRREAALTLIKLQLLGLTDLSNLTIDDMSSLAREIEMWAASAGVDWEGPGISKTLGAVFDTARVGKQDKVIPLVAKKEHLMGIWLETIIREGHVSRYGALLQEIFPADWVQLNIEQSTLTPQLCHSRWTKMWKGKYPAQKNESCEIDTVASSDKLETLKRKLPWQIRARNYGKSVTNYVGLIAKDMKGRSGSGGSQPGAATSGSQGGRKKSAGRRGKVLRQEIGVDPGLKDLVNSAYAIKAATSSDLDAVKSVEDSVGVYKALAGWINSFTNAVKSNDAKAEEFILAPLRAFIVDTGGSKALADSISLVERKWAPKGKAKNEQSSYFLCVSDQRARSEILFDWGNQDRRKSWQSMSRHKQAVASFLVDFGLKTSDRIYGSSPLLRQIVRYAIKDQGSGIHGQDFGSKAVQDWVRANLRTAFVMGGKKVNGSGQRRGTGSAHAAVSLDKAISDFHSDDDDDGEHTESPGDMSEGDVPSEGDDGADLGTIKDKPAHPKGKKAAKRTAEKTAHRVRREAKRTATERAHLLQEQRDVVNEQSKAAAKLDMAKMDYQAGRLDQESYFQAHQEKMDKDRRSDEIAAFLAAESEEEGEGSGKN